MALALFLSSLAAAPAAADGGPAWPVFRADPARTARVDGAGAIASPEVAWELSLGGSLSERELLLADLDGDARPEMLRIAAGRVVAAVPGAAPRWSSPQLGALAIFDVADLDGAGGPEVIALAGRPSAVVILAGDDGRLLWTLPVDSDVVDARAVRPTPGEAPVLVTNHRFQNVEAFGFGGGFVDPATNRLWQSAGPIRWSIGLAFGDTDADGVLDLIKTYDRTVSVLDLRTGAVRASSAALMSEDVYFYSASVADVDGDGRAEILVADYSYFYSEGSGLAVLHESAGAVVPKWAPILFEDDVTSGPGNDVFRHQVVVHANSLADLDGALPLELVFSVWDEAADQWTTRVVNAATGMNVAAMTGEILEAVANLDEDAALEVVTRDVAGIDFAGRPTPFFSSLRAYDVSAGSATDRGFRRADARAALTGSRRRSAGTEAGPVSTWRDVNGDGRPELYIYVNYADEFVNENRADAMEAMRGSDGTSAASYGFPPLAEGTLLDSAPNVLAAGSFDALVFTTDGMLRAIDLAFRDRDAQRTGNHARRPLVVVLEGLARILAVDSTRTLRVIDGRTLAPDAPLLAWQTRNIEQTSARGYVETPGVPVGSALLLRGRAAEDFQRPALVRFSASGEEAFRVALPERVGWSGYGDWHVHDWSGDGVPDVFLTLTQPDGSQRLSVRSSADGAEVRGATLTDVVPGADHFQGGVPADVNGDGAPEIVGSVHPQFVAALDLATTVASAWTVAPAGADRVVNGQLMAGQFDDDADLDLIRANAQNALGPVLRMDLAGGIDARFDTGTDGVASRDVNNPAAARRAGATDRLDVVLAGMAGDRAGRVVLLAGDTLVPRWTTYLGGGTASAETRADASPLFDPAVGDVDGDGDDDVVVGGFDGWLYALDTVDGSLRWSIELGAPAEHVILADVDRDDGLEILVSSRDGMLRALDGAGSYEAEVVTPAPDAGPVDLDAGPPDAGSSRDAAGSPDAGGAPPPPAGCGCRVGAPRGMGGLLLLALAFLAGLRRRPLSARPCGACARERAPRR